MDQLQESRQTWTKPKSLGPLVNKGLAHRFGQYVSPDDSICFIQKVPGKRIAIFIG